MSDPRDHVISVVLSDEEWKAFLSRQPQPVAWLRDRISELISATSAMPPAKAGAAYTRSAISH
jgi:hypothetical protein